MIRVHHSQKEPFSTSTDCEQKALGHTALINNDHLIIIQGLKQLRDNSIRVANAQEGKMAEKVPGNLEARVTLTQHYHAQVAPLVMR